jgi:hypothetical protein
MKVSLDHRLAHPLVERNAQREEVKNSNSSRFLSPISLVFPPTQAVICKGHDLFSSLPCLFTLDLEAFIFPAMQRGLKGLIPCNLHR